ncbi:ornithine--oxo-acid transaminase [Pseudonocardia eucalypti]|uniref:ornithine aminotransferase n=1 Tax=Pseudonocardia eucalypti TaxID=648755 RepID=A0ABP9QDH7_9PSEU|nr:ornithine--oxo-acid transaminase [Pseudonocardia eucalypti]
MTLLADNITTEATEHLRLVDTHAAHNYSPLPVVLASAKGPWATDVDGRRYLDCLSGYSAVSFGHGNEEILAAARAQLERVTLTSRAFGHDQLGPFCAELAELVGKQMVLPMNTGAEAVETGIKVARKWGYEVKGVPDNQASIVVAAHNFHGRTTTVISFSDDEEARAGFGPYTPGFRAVPFGDAEALAAAIDETTVAVLLEPIQGEAGVILPPPGYLARVRELCDANNVLFIADEVQSGLARTGTTLACEHYGVVPDMYLLGKALGGGVMPVSAVVADPEVFQALRPGQHGSTFGGNPLACAVGRAVVGLLATGEYQRRARELGAHLEQGLRSLAGRGVTDVRCIGLWAGVDIDPALGSGREVCERLLAHGVLAKDTHGQTLRLGPPLVIQRDEVELAVAALGSALGELAGGK